jgi:phenylacetate-coenzyme A ligase PaaK-like adenylate-forming protein
LQTLKNTGTPRNEPAGETYAALLLKGGQSLCVRPAANLESWCRIHTATACLPAALASHYGAERLGMTVVPISIGMTERQVQLIVDFKPDVIFVTPSYILAILDQRHAQNIDPRQCSPQIAVCGAEPWTNATRAEIEDACDLHAALPRRAPG